MEDKTQARLQNARALLDALDKTYITPSDIATSTKVIIRAIQEVKKYLETLVKEEAAERAKETSLLVSTISKAKKEIQEQDAKDDARMEKRIIAEVPKLIKKVDISPLENRLTTLENDSEEEIARLDKVKKEIMAEVKTLIPDLTELEDTVEEIKNKKVQEPARIIANVRSMNVYDLSSQCNGVLKTFSVPGVVKALYVMGSDFPVTLFLNNGFTYDAANNQITLQPDNAPSSGSQLGFVYIG